MSSRLVGWSSDGLLFFKGKVEMMRQVNLSDIRALKVSVNMYGDKPLPRPATARAKSRCAEVVYVRVGCLQDNDVWVSNSPAMTDS